MKKVAIAQSNYIPWKGYFDMIAAVDEFILYDDMQYTKNDWRNRNQIKTPQGVKWLTIPVGQNISRRIRDVTADLRWRSLHWKSLLHNYGSAPYFTEIAEWLQPLYLDHDTIHLSQINHKFIEAVCAFLSIKTKISSSWDYTLAEGKTERLVDLCRQAGGTQYVSGPAAQNYLDEHIFEKNGVEVIWFDYAGFPEYPQLWGDFVHGVSILDLLFNCGEKSPQYMRYVK